MTHASKLVRPATDRGESVWAGADRGESVWAGADRGGIQGSGSTWIAASWNANSWFAGVILLLAATLAGVTLGATVGVAPARADSVIDPQATSTPNGSGKATPGTGTIDEGGNEYGNEVGKKSPNSRARIVDDAVAALKQNPPVYVDPRAQLKLTQEQQQDLSIQITATDEPIFVAILPSQAGRPTVVTEAIAKEVGKPGVYVTIVGVVYSAYSTEFEAKHLMVQAFTTERHDGQAAVLSRFVDLAAQELQGKSPEPQPFPGYFVFIVAAMALALPVVLLLSGRRNRGNKSPASPNPTSAGPTSPNPTSAGPTSPGPGSPDPTASESSTES